MLTKQDGTVVLGGGRLMGPHPRCTTTARHVQRPVAAYAECTVGSSPWASGWACSSSPHPQTLNVCGRRCQRLSLRYWATTFTTRWINQHVARTVCTIFRYAGQQAPRDSVLPARGVDGGVLVARPCAPDSATWGLVLQIMGTAGVDLCSTQHRRMMLRPCRTPYPSAIPRWCANSSRFRRDEAMLGLDVP
jgi:hypothetical protein